MYKHTYRYPPVFCNLPTGYYIYMKFLQINPNSGIPKYKQLIQAVEESIARGELQRGDRLPSVNKVCLALQMSRDTVLLAYDTLKKKGVVYAIPGKGYYVKSTEFSFEQRFFVLFDEFNAFKEDVYTSFLEEVAGRAQIDIYFHHFNIAMFRKLIHEAHGHYSKYIIMPTNLMGAAEIIKSLPPNEVYILDQTNEELTDYPAIYQDFVESMYQALTTVLPQLSKYRKLILIFPGFKEPLGMVEGFLKFCRENEFTHEIWNHYEGQMLFSGEVFVVPNDRHLVEIIEQAQRQNLGLGKELGLISYNETPLKKVVQQGITTISTDFKVMGKTLAQMVLQQQKIRIINPSGILIRNSL